MKSFLIALTLITSLMVSVDRARAASIVYQSATGTTDAPFPASVNSDQFLGSRFTLTEQTQVTEVGGVFEGQNNFRTIYAAILEMSGPLPQGDPFNGTEVLASTTLAPSGSGETLAPLSITLQPGDYALVFGSGLFGADGSTGMPANGVDTPEGSGSYFAYVNTVQIPTGWLDAGNLLSGLRFVVVGDTAVVPSPTALSMAVLGLGGLILRRRRAAR